MFSVPFLYKGRHGCLGAVVRCFDFRFRETDQQFAEEILKTKDFDLVAIPGGAKNFVYHTQFAEELLVQVRRVCKNLHHIKQILILNHWDCGGYGGSDAFDSVEEEEHAYHEHLITAKEIFSKQFPHIKVLIGYSKIERDHLHYTLV